MLRTGQDRRLMASALHLRSYGKVGIKIPQRPERGEQDPLIPHSRLPSALYLRAPGPCAA